MHEQPGTSDRNAIAWGKIAGEPETSSLIRSVPLSQDHRVADFTCRSGRVQQFLGRDAADYVRNRYACVFVIADPNDARAVYGYYSLSAALLNKDEITKQDEKKVFRGIPVPLIRIGYMGRDGRAPRGTGAALVVDAARRVYHNGVIAAWGLVLDAEDNNPELVRWYEAVGFKRARAKEGVMYAPFGSLLPELQSAPQSALRQ